MVGKPPALLYNYLDADVLASTDSVAPTRDDGGLENPDVIGRYDLNVGMSLFCTMGKSSAPKVQNCCQHQHLCVVLATRSIPQVMFTC